MNKLFTKIAASVIGMAMAIGVGVAIGRGEVKQAKAGTADFTLSSASNTIVDGVTVSFAKGSGSTAPTWYAAGLRLYAKNTITISASDSISAITFNWEKQGSKDFASVTADGGSYTHPATTGDGTWSGSATTIVFTLGSSGQLQLNTLHVTHSSGGGQSSSWETSAIAISKATALAESIYNTDEEFPELADVTVTKTEHDNNGVANDRDTNVTSSSTLHWIYASDGSAVTLPLANGTYNVKVWASVSNETLTTKDNETAAKQYITGTLTVTDEPQYIVVDSTVTTGNMTGNNDANTKFGLSATDWSIVGTKQSASNLPGFGSDGTTRLYGNANGGNYIVFKTLKAHRYLLSASIEFNGNYSTGAVVREGEGTSGTVVAANNGVYTFSEDTTAFTLINTNSGTTQVRFDTIHIYYEDEAVLTPTLTISNQPSQVGIGSNTASFTLNYYNLTSNFSVSTNSTYLTASYEAASGTGEATIYLSGVAAIASTTVEVSSSGAATQSFDVEVAVLPIIDSRLSSMVWSGTSYAGSPHTLTWNSSYQFVLSAGQLDSGSGYLGANNNNKSIAAVNGASWTLSDTSLDSAMSTAGNWSTYGQALYMSNFGVVHPTQFIINAAAISNEYVATYYILASADSGDSWSVLTSGSVAAGNMSWNGNTYSSNPSPIQFAFVTTGTSYGSINGLTVKIYGDSYTTTKVLDSIYVDDATKCVTEYFVGENFDIGTAKVYARYTNQIDYPDEDVTQHCSYSAIEHGTTSITITYMNKTTSVNVTVEDYGDVYKKATSSNELLNGSKVVIGLTNGGHLMGAQQTNNRHSEASETNNTYSPSGVTTYSVNTAVFTVGVVEEGNNVYYTFKDANDEYLYPVASSNNYLRSRDSINDSCKWTVAFGENGSAQISRIVSYKDQNAEEATDHTKYMGGSSTVFGCYTSNSNFLSLYVDVAHNVQLFIDANMHTNIEYDDDPDLPVNNNGACKDSNWYVDAKAAIIALGADYISEFQNNNTFANAYERYQAWALACGDSTPFEGVGIVPANGGLLPVANNNNSSLVVVVVSALTLTTLGAFFFMKKRKEQ